MNINDFDSWEPINQIPYDELYFSGIKDLLGKVVLHLKVLGNENKMLEIKFDGVQAYRVVQEYGRLKSLNENPSMRKFRTSVNSDFLKWFEEESLGQFRESNLVHYMVSNIDNIIDVIARQPVSIEWVPCGD
ncbi:hypothetical protein [Pedobacter frigoris]|uniref:hypothetical protein n=1 Tax=Pedobacter frigoris TaxID=2571272 RepID=UPI00292D5B0C|nr:hypothetical protein [Pedobacter frigoris]